MILQKCVAFVFSPLLLRAVSKEVVGLEKALTTDLVLVNRNGKPELLGKPAAGLPDYHVWCWALEAGARILCQGTLSSQVKNHFCLLWMNLLSWFFLTFSETTDSDMPNCSHSFLGPEVTILLDYFCLSFFPIPSVLVSFSNPWYYWSSGVMLRSCSLTSGMFLLSCQSLKLAFRSSLLSEMF